MTQRPRLYERAANGPPDPLWRIGDGHSVFAGPLQFNALHEHAVPVLAAGLHGAFGLRVGDDARWTTCEAAVIPAGTPYALDVGGNPLTVFYLEPNVAGVDALAPLLKETKEVSGVLVGRADARALLRAFYEDATSAAWSGEAIGDLLNFSRRRPPARCDGRVNHILSALQAFQDHSPTAAEMGRLVGLSPSRFQHVFAKQTGVAFRRYRTWLKLRRAIGEIIGGSNFTAASHAAGFYDQAHFARHFRRSFGAPASHTLRYFRA